MAEIAWRQEDPGKTFLPEFEIHMIMYLALLSTTIGTQRDKTIKDQKIYIIRLHGSCLIFLEGGRTGSGPPTFPISDDRVTVQHEKWV